MKHINKLILTGITLSAVFLAAFAVADGLKLKEVEYTPIEKGKILTTIAFGSCNDQKKDQPLWSEIGKQNPDLWIWLGDNIYADTEDMSVMKAKYDKQNSNPNYAEFKRNVPIVGIWDDHDYGQNDAGAKYAMKKESRDLLLQFLHVPASNGVWKREGAYQSYTFGKEDKKVKVILLDGRYFRGRQLRGDKKYMENPFDDILGEAQWKWLEEELTNSNAKVHIIGTGIQVIPEEHIWEKWANFPNARKRFFELIKKTKPEGCVLLTGDRHHGEISKKEIDGLDHPLYEITSSSLNKPYEGNTEESNKHRVGKVVGEINYGLIEIDWDASPRTVTFKINGKDGTTHEEQSIKLK